MSTITKLYQSAWPSFMLAWLILISPSVLQAQLGVAGRDDADFRLNLLRTEIITPHGQQPPYEWSAVYLQDPVSNSQSGPSYVLDSSICGQGVINTTQFGNELKIYYSYDNDGALNEIIFRQEQTAGVYENYSRKSYTYDNGNRTGYRYQLWNDMGSNWEDDYEEKTTYNSEDKQASFMIREASGPGQWNNLFREQRNYDSAGNLIEVLSATWHNNDWLDTARKEIVYNEIGFYTKIYDEAWNGSDWDTLSRESAIYDNLGMIWESYLFEENTPSGFEGVVREGYQYDQYGFWTGMTRQVWDNNNWENSIQESYLYNRAGNWLAWEQETYQGMDWVNNIRQYYKKGDSMRQDVMQEWDVASEAWENKFSVLTRFDGTGNLIQEAGIQVWNDNVSEWRNDGNSRMCRHSWSASSATSIEPELSELSCTLANPYRVYEPIHCEALQPDKQYDIRLMDMQGRTVYQKQVPGGDLFSIDRTLPTGMYHLSVYENKQVRFLRKIIINN